MGSWDGSFSHPHTRQESTSSLQSEFADLPPGWSVGKTAVGAIYFIECVALW